MKYVYIFLMVFLIFGCESKSGNAVKTKSQIHLQEFSIGRPDFEFQPTPGKKLQGIVTIQEVTEKVKGNMGHISEREIVADKNSVEAFIKSSAEFDNTSLQIDVLLQGHQDPKGGSQYSSESSESQKLVMQFLKEVNPKSYGLEGFYTDLSVSRRVDYTKEIILDLNPNSLVTTEEVANAVRLSISQNAGFVYHSQNPNSLAYGTERKSLMLLQATAMTMRDKGTVNQNLFNEVVNLRSQFAVATAIRQLHDTQSKATILIIGANHGMDMFKIANYFGIKINIYIALPPQVRKEFYAEIKKGID